MNCRDVISRMGFSCRELGGDTLRVWSPFSYGNDGERIGLYVEKIPTGYVVTDNCEALMHAASMGINLTTGRIDSLRNVTGFRPGLISPQGEISALVPEEDLDQGMAAVLNAAIAVSHFERQWTPRKPQESFVNQVAEVLEAKFGDRVQRKVTATGASGHQLELPIGIRFDGHMTYVQPIAADDDAMDWKNVYASFGRMSDLKSAGDSGISRLIVLEEASNEEDMRKAIGLLSTSAPVVYFSNLGRWAEQKAA